ncbi:MAG: hypothetical protein M1835_007811 [Candelina submexicana]|nr:MAG: hypothetical protein M1835_007811 [Candelina submexicana]
MDPSVPATHSTTYPFISPSKNASTIHGKVVVITGASRGIGASCARSFAAAGAQVACLARNQAALSELVTSLKETYRIAAISLVMDITDATTPSRMVEETEATLGPIDILVNNAGGLRYKTFESEGEFEDWWSVFALNYRAPVSLIHAVLPSMLERGEGTIISMGSTAGVQSSPFCTAYSTGKAALVKFHQELEAEIRGRGVRSFVMHPGEVDTGSARVPGAVDMENVAKTPKMARYLQELYGIEMQVPELAADTAVTLCGDEGAAVLSGRFVDARVDLAQVIENARKERSNT